MSRPISDDSSRLESQTQEHLNLHLDVSINFPPHLTIFVLLYFIESSHTGLAHLNLNSRLVFVLFFELTRAFCCFAMSMHLLHSRTR